MKNKMDPYDLTEKPAKFFLLTIPTWSATCLTTKITTRTLAPIAVVSIKYKHAFCQQADQIS